MQMIIWQRQDTASVLQETFWWDMTLTTQNHGTTTDQCFPQQLPVQLPGITECAYALSGKEATILPDVNHFHQRSSCGCQLYTGFTTLRHISMERLRKCLPKDAITARLGGDEFVSFILTDILKHSDAILYEEKVKRRASIRK